MSLYIYGRNYVWVMSAAAHVPNDPARPAGQSCYPSHGVSHSDREVGPLPVIDLLSLAPSGSIIIGGVLHHMPGVHHA